MEKILPESFGCGHSITHPNCVSCKINNEIRHRRKEIEDKLNSENSENIIFHLDSEYKWYDATKTSPSNNVKVIVKLKNGDEIEAWQQFGEWPDGLEVIEWRFK